MSIQAQSADGVIHEFPDGTPDAVVDGAMRNYAASAGPPKAASPPAPKGIVGNITGFMANLNRGLGIGDELAAGANTAGNLMTGKIGLGDIPHDFTSSMAKQRAVEDGFSAAHPLTAALAKGTGNAALMAVPAGPGAEAFAGGNLMTNAVRGATTAGLTGAAYGAVDRGTVKQRLMTAANAAHDPVTLGLGAVGGMFATPGVVKSGQAKAPSLEELTTQKDAAYKAMRDGGVALAPGGFSDLSTNMADAMDKEGFNAGLHPKAAAMMDRIGQSAAGAGGDFSPTLDQIDQLRQQIGRDVASSNDAGERRMGVIMRGAIDNYLAKAGPEDLIGADPQAAVGLLSKARDLNTRIAKLQSLDQQDQAAADRASVSGSGGNINNATRQNVVRFKNAVGNLTPDEQAAAQKVIDGTPAGNALRQVGKLSPQGNGLMTAGHIAAILPTHGASAGVAVGGAVAKIASDAITARNVGALRSLIASGGQAAQEVSRQLADPAYADLRAQLANDLAVAAGVQGTARRGSVTVQVEGHPEYGVATSHR